MSLNNRFFQLLVVLSLSFSTMSLPTTLLAAQKEAAVVLAARGEVSAVIKGEQPRNLKRHSLLYSGETIVTKNGEAQVQFTDGCLLTIYRDTRFVIDDYQFANKKQKNRANFSLLNGLIHTMTGTIGKDDPDNYKLETTMAMLGIRGTDFRMLKSDDLLVSMLDGKVVLSNDGGSLEVSVGQNAVVTGSDVMPRLTSRTVNPALYNRQARKKTEESKDSSKKSRTRDKQQKTNTTNRGDDSSSQQAKDGEQSKEGDSKEGEQKDSTTKKDGKLQQPSQQVGDGETKQSSQLSGKDETQQPPPTHHEDFSRSMDGFETQEYHMDSEPMELQPSGFEPSADLPSLTSPPPPIGPPPTMRDVEQDLQEPGTSDSTTDSPTSSGSTDSSPPPPPP
ncbi:MAG: FecR domain-containing protein [Magnetococcales bacterium]|nr:FecR domain-containing protein [Magnetococcales bacterium]